MGDSLQNKRPLSLVDFLRKRLMLGSQCPSVEEEAERYINELKADMKEKWFWARDSDKEHWRDQGYAEAVERIFGLLEGGL
jgi:hypothetical protein